MLNYIMSDISYSSPQRKPYNVDVLVVTSWIPFCEPCICENNGDDPRKDNISGASEGY